MEETLQIDWSFLERMGENPFLAMWFLFANGGWIIFLWLMLTSAVRYWQGYKQGVFTAKKAWVVLAIDIPKLQEQGPRAIENMFAYLAGAHSSNTWTEDWFVGRTQDTISCEIISIEGRVQFVIRTTKAMRDLVESAIYAPVSRRRNHAGGRLFSKRSGQVSGCRMGFVGHGNDSDQVGYLSAQDVPVL
jgi:hypothetical protein